jgi:hypothetical protein
MNERDLGTIIEEGKSSLLNLYAENLKPLFFETDLNNEDIFNFALYNNLPVDKENNKVLQLAEDSKRNQVFAIQPALIKDNTNNYGKFKKSLQLTDQEVERLDSILQSYRSDIYAAVLVGDGAVAVNPELPLIQKAIINDIYSYIYTIDDENKGFYVEADPGYEPCENIKTAVESVRKANRNHFILFAADTVFDAQFEFDKAKFAGNFAAGATGISSDQPAQFKVNAVTESKNEALRDKKTHFTYKINSEVKTAFIPHEGSEKDVGRSVTALKGLEKFEVDSENMLVRFEADSLQNIIKLNISSSSGSNEDWENLSFEFNLAHIDTLLEEYEIYFENADQEFEKYEELIDSLAREFEIKIETGNKKTQKK